ncbi:hypothetical protein RJ639_047031 [Escallonia herrerae]|uniref:Uncharacterized protein n=1 Tax=Escallonia herrerae TaxID=1293975 RepID=A0AA88W916_9ASTE|nr:hypothetical protein RJ639_047027 [Escallonia herrerae]KAK3022209.1 hypothetical protein RJ639_047031 [Escallonia herrerae]
MAASLDSLRSHLPPEMIKGKRSMLDHVTVTVDYITCKQKNMKELSLKRDKLERSTLVGSGNIGSSSRCTRSCITVLPFLGGASIVLNYGGLDKEDLQLSKVVELLLEEGLNIVSCLSTKVGDNLLHTIYTQVLVSPLAYVLFLQNFRRGCGVPAPQQKFAALVSF